MSLLDSDPISKDYYTVRVAIIDNKTGLRRYSYTPATLLDGMGALQFAQKYQSKTVPGKTIEALLMMYDYGKHSWLKVPGFGQ